MDSVRVFHAGMAGMDFPVLLALNPQHLRTQDLAAKIAAAFASLPPRRCLPPRTDGILANVAGDCYRGDE